MIGTLPSEKQIEKLILTWLNLQKNVMAFKVNTVGIFDVKKGIFRKNKNPFVHLGTSDIIGVCNGTFFCIEVKTPKRLREVTENQIRFINHVKQCGGYGFVATSLEQVERFINCLKSIPKTCN